MKKAIIWIFALFILVLPSVFAQINYAGSGWSSNGFNMSRLGNETFDSLSNFSAYTAPACTVSAGNLECAAGQDIAFHKHLINNSEWNSTCEWKMQVNAMTADTSVTRHWSENGTGSGGGAFIAQIVDGGTNLQIRRSVDNGRHDISGVTDNGAWRQWKMTFYTNRSVCVEVDGASNTCTTALPTTGDQGGYIGYFEFFNNDGTATQRYDNFTCYNGTIYPSVSISDTMSPEITFYNMTSEGGEGCTNWNTNKANACVTNDTTPTTFFRTNENSFCAVGVSNANYTNMGSSRNCTGGEGTNEHTCTLTPQDELTQANSNIYISCKDIAGNQNLTSTSGALALNIHAKETGGVQAIGVGVQNALLSGYANYTSQQIYARKLNNNQFTGTFDWVAKKGSKVWALNYISNGESHVASTFNLTPVLYVLQLTNTTQQQVTLLVEQMINATK